LLDTALNAVGLEVILVDVSPNCTAERIREINRCGRRVCCLQRIGRASPPPASKALGLHPRRTSLFCDAHMRHDEKLLPQMMAILESLPITGRAPELLPRSPTVV
jgi:hypothetical protein